MIFNAKITMTCFVKLDTDAFLKDPKYTPISLVHYIETLANEHIDQREGLLERVMEEAKDIDFVIEVAD